MLRKYNGRTSTYVSCHWYEWKFFKCLKICRFLKLLARLTKKRNSIVFNVVHHDNIIFMCCELCIYHGHTLKLSICSRKKFYRLKRIMLIIAPINWQKINFVISFLFFINFIFDICTQMLFLFIHDEANVWNFCSIIYGRGSLFKFIPR